MKKSDRIKIILPLNNAKFVVKELMDHYESTLHKPVGDEIKVVPKDMLEAGEKGRKSLQLNEDCHQSDPLAKYRHLKITYMTISRPKKNDNEAFLPAESILGDKEKDDIINYRFELLKRLNDQFRKHLQEEEQRQEHGQSPTTTKQKSPCSYCDSPPLKDVNETNFDKPKPDMSAKTKILSEGSAIIKTSLKRKPKIGSEKGTRPDGKTNHFGSLKPDGDDKKNGPKGVRPYSTNSDKLDDCDKKNTCADDAQETTDVCDSIESRASEELDEQEECSEVQSPEYDIAEEVPHAFTCASDQLEEERQANLYYRYHPMTWIDLHLYLHQKRTFSVDAEEKKKLDRELEEKNEKNANECEEPSSNDQTDNCD